MAFWITACLLLAIVGFFVLWPLVTRRIVAPVDDGAEDVQIYRDQLAEVDREEAKGLLAAEEAATTRLEVSRRLLEADARAARHQEPKGPLGAPGLALGLACFIAAASVGLYLHLGAAGRPDMPLAERLAERDARLAARPTQEEVEARLRTENSASEQADPAYLALIAELRKTVAGRPDDMEGHELLATHEANLGNFAAAWRAKARAVELKGAGAPAQDFTDLAELMIVATGGYVSPKAERVLSLASEMAPKDPRNRYYSGLAFAQGGRPDLTAEIWKGLLDEGPADAPWIRAIESQLPELTRQLAERGAGDLPGPDASDVENAGDLEAKDRAEMIRGMVTRLSERLAAEGGSAAEWARLIRALNVLGEDTRGRTIWQEARSAFAGNDAALGIVDQAAREAGYMP